MGALYDLSLTGNIFERRNLSHRVNKSVAGFVEAGTRTVGGYAGDAIIRAGDLIESTGRGVGTSVESAAISYGDKIKGQGTVTTTKANLPKTPTPKTKAITSGKASGTHPATLQRSFSSPVSSQAKKTAVTANKRADTISKPASSPSTGKQTATKKHTPYPSASTNVSTPDTSKPKPYPGTTTYPSKVDAPKPKPYPGTTMYPSKTDASKPKPYPGTTTYSSKTDASKPKPYPGTTSYPSRTDASSAPNPKPYPGTTTYPNSGKKTAVKPAKKPTTPALMPAKTEGTFKHI